MTKQNTTESFAEVAVTTRIDDRIQRRIDIASPEQRGHHGVRRILTSRTQRPGEVPGEERKPADDERTDHDAERHGGLVFTTKPTAP